MKYLVLLLLLTGCAGRVHLENDFFASFHPNQDKYYTHGTKLSSIKETESFIEEYSLNQTIFTPSKKRPDADPALLKTDMPYSGFLFGEYRLTEMLDEDSQYTFGVQAGCFGECSYAKEVQSFVHKLLDQNIPTWDKNYALKSEPGLNIELERKEIILKGENYDFSSYVNGKLGNILNSVSLGTEFRYGFNLDTFSSTPIIFRVSKEKKTPWTFYGFTRVAETLNFYDHSIDGSLWQQERHHVNSELNVQTMYTGITLGYGQYKLTYTYFFTTDMWKERDSSMFFGGVDFRW